MYLNIFITLLMSYLLIIDFNSIQPEVTETFTDLMPITSENTFEITELLVINEENLSINQAVFNADTTLIAYRTEESLTMWDINNQIVKWRLPPDFRPFEFSLDGLLLLTSTDDSISLLSTETGNEVITFLSPNEPLIQGITDAAFARNGNEVVLVYRGEGAGLVRWQVDSNEFISAYTYELDWSDPPDYSILSLDGNINAIMPNGQTVELRNTVRGDIQNRLQVDRELSLDDEATNYRIVLLALSYDNQKLLLNRLVDGSPQASSIAVLSSSGEIITEISQDHGLVIIGTFSPNGELIALGNRENGEIYIWNSETGEELAVLTGHTEWITSLSFNADGTLLMSSSTDGTVRLWGVPAGE